MKEPGSLMAHDKRTPPGEPVLEAAHVRRKQPFLSGVTPVKPDGCVVGGG